MIDKDYIVYAVNLLTDELNRSQDDIEKRYLKLSINWISQPFLFDLHKDNNISNQLLVLNEVSKRINEFLRMKEINYQTPSATQWLREKNLNDLIKMI